MADVVAVSDRLSWRRRWWRQVVNLFALIGVVMTVYLLCFDLTFIGSDSMAPTLVGEIEKDTGHDWILMERVSYWFRRPARWEIVAFTQQELGVDVMKRVAALPGERIALDHGSVCIDGKRLDPPPSLKAVQYFPFGNLSKEQTCRTGYYVLGDNSRDSEDSRFTGEVAAKRIKGRAWLIVWPPSRMRFLTP